MKLILPLNSPDANLENAGGKGANLARLARAGFPVPGGFILVAGAYQAFVAANKLASWILASLQDIDPEAPAALEAASEAIRTHFTVDGIPSEIAEQAMGAYAALGGPPVAVRSSATAEDLPEMSFAGQQDTYLNVIGEDALLDAVVRCWSSLWTARAIGYRARNRISHAEVSLAVVVQRMLPAEASGVMFTANPLSGARGETVIEATLGLGEALVAGLVEPDHYVVDVAQNRVLSKTLGGKALTIRGKTGGGVEKVAEDAGRRQALPDAQILALAGIGRQIDHEYGFPQDIEWAWSDGSLDVLQSRPITALFPLPEDIEAGELRVLFSFGAVQGMLDPMTPLGRDAIRLIFAGGASLFGYRLTHTSQGIIRVAGERLWADVTTVFRNRLGRRLALGALDFIEPSVGLALENLKDDPRLQPQGRALGLGALRRILPFALSTFGQILRLWRDPDGQRIRLQAQVEQKISSLQNDLLDLRAEHAASGEATAKLAQGVALFRRLFFAFPIVVPTLVPGIAAAMASLNLLNRLAAEPASQDQGFSTQALKITRGVPHNVTTEMDLALWETARILRKDPLSQVRFLNADSQAVAADYLAGRLAQPAQKAIAEFLDQYGMRGIGEIDIGRPRWREDPTHIMQVLGSYLGIEDKARAPDAIFKRASAEAETAIGELESTVRSTPGGWFKAKLVRWAARRVRALIGMRESPKFYIIRMMGIIRQGLLESGRDFVEAGYLAQTDDLFFLTLDELESLAGNASPDWSREWMPRIAERRAAYRREQLRVQIPRLLLSDGRAFYEGLGSPSSSAAQEQLMIGSPVSPGVVEGEVHVVLDPHTTRLAPGEILVCPGTDPAWTPLFLAAGGLVMEVGGMMTHGSVVAREYGIPAVVGVHQATTRLKTGQRVRLDGSTGRIIVLDETA